ncbi:putative nicotinamide N-methyltransferase, partial [Kockovaella imperatae]
PESPLPPPYSFATYTVPADRTLSPLQGGNQIITRLVGSHPLWGHHLWNTARVLTDYLLEHSSLVKGKKILELGAGAALPSLVAALKGANQVTITDYPDQELLDNMQWNVDTNVPLDIRPQTHVKGFLWGADPTPLMNGPEDRYDLLILSDLVFNHSQHKALISSVNSLLSLDLPSNGEMTPCVLIFITHHRPHLADADMAFLPALAESGDGWGYEQVVTEWTGVMFDEDPGDEKLRGTVKGFRAWRRRKEA